MRWPGPHGPVYQITEVKPDGIAWIRPVNGGDATCFIYRFTDGWNKLAMHCNKEGEA